MARKPKKIELFMVHGLEQRVPLDYEEFFERLAQLPPSERSIMLDDDSVVGVTSPRREDDVFHFQAYTGTRNESPIILNLISGETSELALGAERVQVYPTHVGLDLSTRLAGVEYNQRGPKFLSIARALELIGGARLGLVGFEFHFAPVVSADFVDQVKEFERIRIVSLSIERPNASWNDSYEAALRSLAARSNARIVNVEAHAARGDQIALDDGLVETVTRMAQTQDPALRNAKVVGTREGETQETNISLNKHVEHIRVNVDVLPSGNVSTPAIETQIGEFLRAKRSPEA